MSDMAKDASDASAIFIELEGTLDAVSARTDTFQLTSTHYLAIAWGINGGSSCEIYSSRPRFHGVAIG